MSQEIVYTSAPKGLKPGSSGFCTVASTAGMARNLAEARRHGFRAVGILSHHLAHDDQAWETLGDLMERMAGEGATWVHADTLIAEAEAPHRPATTQGTHA